MSKKNYMKDICCVSPEGTHRLNSPFLSFPSTIDAGSPHLCDTIYTFMGKKMKNFYAICNMLPFIVLELKKWEGRANCVILSP